MPLVRPVTAAVAALAFVLTWSNFLDPLVYVYDRDLFTLPLALRSLSTLDPTNFPVFLAGAVLATVPPLVVFALAQRRFLHDDYRDGTAPVMRLRTAMLAAVLAATPLVAAAAARRRAATPAGRGRPSVRLLVFGAPEELAAYRTLVDAYAEAASGRHGASSSRPATASDLIARLSTSIAGGDAARRVPDELPLLRPVRGQGRDRAARRADRRPPTTVEPDDFYPTAMDAFRWQGQQLCLPQNVSSLAVYYNRDLFEQVRRARAASRAGPGTT